MNSLRSLGLALVVGMALSAWERQARADELSDDLAPFARNSGIYSIAPGAGSGCTNGFESLALEIDPAAGTITETFTGKGEINGLPTAGQAVITVSLAKTTPRLNSDGQETERTVLSGNVVIVQDSIWAPLFGEFGGWKDESRVLELGGDSVTVAYSGYNCLFNKK